MIKFIKNNMTFLLIVSLAILLPNICIAVKSIKYDWQNIRTPFTIKDGHKMKSGDLIVNVIIANEIDMAGKTVKLNVDYSGRPSAENNFALNVNNSISHYKVRSAIKIKTKHLKQGVNVFKFLVRDKETGLVSDSLPRVYGNIKIKKLSFTEFK